MRKEKEQIRNPILLTQPNQFSLKPPGRAVFDLAQPPCAKSAPARRRFRNR